MYDYDTVLSKVKWEWKRDQLKTDHWNEMYNKSQLLLKSLGFNNPKQVLIIANKCGRFVR